LVARAHHASLHYARLEKSLDDPQQPGIGNTVRQKRLQVVAQRLESGNSWECETRLPAVDVKKLLSSMSLINVIEISQGNAGNPRLAAASPALNCRNATMSANGLSDRFVT
jgi:hypothetical protein